MIENAHLQEIKGKIEKEGEVTKIRVISTTNENTIVAAGILDETRRIINELPQATISKIAKSTIEEKTSFFENNLSTLKMSELLNQGDFIISIKLPNSNYLYIDTQNIEKINQIQDQSLVETQLIKNKSFFRRILDKL